MDIQEVSYYSLVCYAAWYNEYWISQIFQAVGCNLEEYLFTSPGLAEQWLKEKFIPSMDEVCKCPLYHCPSGLEYRRHPSGLIDFVVISDNYITISRHFQARTVTVNKVKKVVVVDGDEYVREVEEKTYGEWTEVKAQVEVTFYRYRKGH